MAEAHETAEPLRQHEQDHWAIGLTFCVARDRQLFRTDVARTLMPLLIALRDARRIGAVLPFHHRPLKVRGNADATSWTDYWVVVIAPSVDPDEIWRSVSATVGRAAERSALGFLRAEVLRPQPGLQMYYPRERSLVDEMSLWHWIEFAVSRPDTRQAYYQDQYRFSAPAIRRFYEAGAVGRCIGYEVAKVLENRGVLPEWDVIHVTGVMHFLETAWILGRHMSFFNSLARRQEHSSALDMIRSWRVQREKYQVHGVQDPTFTLQPVKNASLVTASTAPNR